MCIRDSPQGGDAGTPPPAAGPMSGPPSKKDKAEVDKALGDAKNQMNDLSKAIKKAPPELVPGGDKKMPTGEYSMRDIIKMAVSKTAQDPAPSPDMAPPAPPAMPGEAQPLIPGGDGATPSPSVKLEKIADSPDYNAEYDTDGNSKIEAVKSSAGKVSEQTLTMNKAVESVVNSLRDLCKASEGNDVAASAGELKSQTDGLKSYLEEKWPNKDQLKSQTGPENSGE